jgi:glycosyltransferase involved in cell wall biosynthesis
MNQSMKLMVDILLSTYNGQRYIREQLDSIVAQTFSAWRILIRDDGSSDDTVRTIQKHSAYAQGKIHLLESKKENLGASLSFARLLEHSNAEYVMFSDQDDVWLPEKIARTIGKLREMEERHGRNTPLLVFSDATVVDKELNVVAPSMWSYQNSDPEIVKRLNRLLLMNPANGCTMMFNRALIRRALPIPREALMHDTWLGLVASAFGKVGYLPEPTLFYRQHDKNESVTKKWGLNYVLAQLRTLGAAKNYNLLTRKQAAAFLERYRPDLAESQTALLSAYAHLDRRGFIAKRLDIFRYGFFYVGIIRNIGWLLIC